VSPNTAPTSTSKESGVSELNTQKEAEERKCNPADELHGSVGQCPKCCSVEQPHQKTKEEQAREESEALLDRGYKLAAIVGVVVALIGVATLIWQTRVTRASWQRQLRAYVCIPTAMLKFYSDTLFEAQVHAKNEGQTPAYNVDHRINIAIENRETKFADLKQPGNLAYRSSSAMLGPDQEIILTRQEDGSTKAPLGYPNSTIFVYGIVTYDDAFGEERYTRFCFTWGAIHGGRKITKNGEQWGLLQGYSEGNEAT
jgi:hypothetical protein